MSLTRAQIRRAARLYLLKNTASLDLGGCETEEQVAVVEAAVAQARRQLEQAAPGASGISSLQGIIDFVAAEGRS